MKPNSKPKETRPITYRISGDVDKALRKLAKAAGGIDRALRKLMGMAER